MSLLLLSQYDTDSESDDKDNISNIYLNHEEEKIFEDVLQVMYSILDMVEHTIHYDNSFDTNKFQLYSYRPLIMEVDESEREPEAWTLSGTDESESDLETTNLTKDSCKTAGELGICDLPPIEKLTISVDLKCLVQIGIIHSIIDPLVLIHSFKNVPVLDIDSVLFCKDGSSLGKIFDVIGPVSQPDYILRFNSKEEIRQCGLQSNSPIYYAFGQKDQITKYVFVHDLEKDKGSDASWKDNNEPPPEELDYSDDETERMNNWKRKAKTRR